MSTVLIRPFAVWLDEEAIEAIKKGKIARKSIGPEGEINLKPHTAYKVIALHVPSREDREPLKEPELASVLIVNDLGKPEWLELGLCQMDVE